MVGDPKTMEPVPQDGETMGEIFMRGNDVMKGYLKTRRQPKKRLPAVGFIPAISASGMRTAISN